MPISDNDGFFSLILHQKLTGVHFLKVSYNVDAKTTSLYFSYVVKLKPIGLIYFGSLRHAYFITSWVSLQKSLVL